MKRFDLILTAVCIALVSGAATNPANAQETNAALSLDALVDEVLDNNPELDFYEAEIAAAKAGRNSAGALANPELSVGLGQKRVNAGNISAEGVAWSASLIQPFEWPGRIGLRKAIANRDIELAELGRERFKIALAGRVRSLAYGLFAAQEKAAAAGEVAERFKALREVLVQRDPAGLTPLLETRVIEATELNAQRKASDATLSAQAALLKLNQLRGVPTETHLIVARSEITFEPLDVSGRARHSVRAADEPTTTERRSRNDAPYHDWLRSLARTNNFELRMRAVELAQQGFRVKLARNERYPALAIGPTFSEEKVGDDREQIIGMEVSVPLPLWNRNGANITAAKARQHQAEISFNLTQRDIERQVITAALTYETKLREMAKWRPDSVQHFKDAAELADRHYRLGAVPISTYVELQQQYLEAVESLLDTKREALEAAAQLELLTGLPLPLASTATEEKK